MTRHATMHSNSAVLTSLTIASHQPEINPNSACLSNPSQVTLQPQPLLSLPLLSQARHNFHFSINSFHLHFGVFR